MKIGLIIPICTQHAMQERALRMNRTHTRADTDCIVLVNGGGASNVVMPDGYERMTPDAPLTDESDLWQFALELALYRGWSWTMIVHDDFAMQEGGWESDLEAAAEWRVAVASWCVFTDWQAPGASLPALGHLGVAVDPMTFGFKTDVFAERGYLTRKRWGFGFAAWDVCAWALDNGYGAYRILRSAEHQWDETNSRALLGTQAPGHPEVSQEWAQRGVLPAHVESDGRTINLGDGRRCEIALPHAAAAQPRRRVSLSLNYGSQIVTDGATGESLHYLQTGTREAGLQLQPGPFHV